MKKEKKIDFIWIVLVFDIVEYCNCLEEVYICFNREQVNSIYSKHYKCIKMGFIDIYTYRYVFNDSYDFPIRFY